MPAYLPIRTANEQLQRLKNLILILSEEGIEPTALLVRIGDAPQLLISRALTELGAEGKLELRQFMISEMK